MIAILWRQQLVAGNSVVVQEPGDSLTLTVQDDMNWNERWKLCMSMENIIPNLGPSTTEAAEALLLMGSKDGELVEKIGLGFASPSNGITTIEVVQTKRNVTAGIIEIWTSEEQLTTNQKDFESCIVYAGSGISSLEATLQEPNVNQSVMVEKSVNFTEPINTTEVTFEKLDSKQTYTIKDVSVQTKCDPMTEELDADPDLCTSYSASLQYSDYVSLAGNTTALLSTSYCTGGGLLFTNPSTSEHHQQVSVKSLSGWNETSPTLVSVCAEFVYGNTKGGGIMKLDILNSMDNLITSVNLNEDGSFLIKDGNGNSKDSPPSMNVLNSFCMKWQDVTFKLLLNGESSEVTESAPLIPFSVTDTLKIDVQISATAKDDFFIQLMDLNVYGVDIDVHHEVCDSFSSNQAFPNYNHWFAWNSRRISSVQGFQVTTRPTFFRPVIPIISTPVITCSQSTALSSPHSSKMYAIEKCYHDLSCQMIRIDQSSPPLYTPYTLVQPHSTSGVDCIPQEEHLTLANLETYDFGDIIPAMGYTLDNISAMYHVASNGSECLDILSAERYLWSVATYSAFTKTCAYTYDDTHQVRNELMVNDYYSTVFLPKLGEWMYQWRYNWL